MRRRKLLRWLIWMTGCGLVIGSIVLWWIGGALVAPANCVVGPPPGDLPVESFTLPSKSGSTVAAWYVPHEKARATAILLHPIRGNRRSMLTRAKLFYHAGYSVLLIDLQAHGESPGEHITVGHLERHDVAAAVDFVRNKTPDHAIVVVGRSLGGAAALLGSPLGIDALVLESVYPTIEEAVDNRIRMRLGSLSNVITPLLVWQLPLRLGISPDKLRPIDHMASIGCPVLVMAGDQDRHTTSAETRRMFEAAKEPKELVFFEGAGHEDLLAYDPHQYGTAVLGFLARHLNTKP